MGNCRAREYNEIDSWVLIVKKTLVFQSLMVGLRNFMLKKATWILFKMVGTILKNKKIFKRLNILTYLLPWMHSQPEWQCHPLLIWTYGLATHFDSLLSFPNPHYHNIQWRQHKLIDHLRGAQWSYNYWSCDLLVKKSIFQDT